jgi:zinc transport system permease protein
MVFTLAGLWVSYQFNLASGATIIMVAGVGFFLSLAIDAIAARRPSADR